MLSSHEWSLNRDSTGIVYCFADGTSQIIQVDDYLQEHPEYTSADFEQIKALSDEIHQCDCNSDSVYWRNKSSVDFDDAAALIAAEGVELCSILIQREQRKIAVRAALRLLRSNKISRKQKRRFVAYFLHGKTIAEMARFEAVNKSSICRGINDITQYLRTSIPVN